MYLGPNEPYINLILISSSWSLTLFSLHSEVMEAAAAAEATDEERRKEGKEEKEERER